MRWTTLGVERHVDLWTKQSAVHSIPRSRPGMTEAPVPRWDEGLEQTFPQRQRMDMTSPATMAPKPTAKFQAPSDTMIGMRSPAT